MTDRDPLYRRHRFPAEIIAHTVWFMDHGQLVESAPTQQFFGQPKSDRLRRFLSATLKEQSPAH